MCLRGNCGTTGALFGLSHIQLPTSFLQPKLTKSLVTYKSHINSSLHLARKYHRMFPGIQSRDAFRPIACERKYLTDYKCVYYCADILEKERKE